MDIYWCIHWELWKHSQQTGCVSIAQSWKSLSFRFVTNNAGPTRKWCTHAWKLRNEHWECSDVRASDSSTLVTHFWDMIAAMPITHASSRFEQLPPLPCQLWGNIPLPPFPAVVPSSSSYPCLACWISSPPPTQSFSLFIHGEQSSFTDGAMQSAFSPPTIHSTRGMRSGWRGIHFQIQIQKSGLQMKLTKVRWGKCSVNHPPDIFWHLAW